MIMCALRSQHRIRAVQAADGDPLLAAVDVELLELLDALRRVNAIEIAEARRDGIPWE